MTTAKKVTLATVKSMIRKNLDAGTLMIKCKSSFDGMIDGTVRNQNAQFKPAVKTESMLSYTHGVDGAWFVGSSRDYFSGEKFDAAGKLIHVDVYNSCGSFSLMVSSK